jgi:peptidoglycan/xylan/chitin deacetylase (PgdA/CDA1 family)
MRYLSDAGYSAVTLQELSGFIERRVPLPAKTIVITFDDGFRNFYTEALPALCEHGFKATVFLVTGFCGGHNDWAGNPAELPRSELLSWSEIRDASGYGIEFGSHTTTHPDLTRLTRDEVEREITASKHKIADELGIVPVTFAYPFGRSNPVVRDLAGQNFISACTTDLGMVYPGCDPGSLNRIDTYYLKNRRVFENIASSGFEHYMRFRQVMRTVRSSLAHG